MSNAALDPRMNYRNLISKGFPFVDVKRINLNDKGMNIQDEVDATVINGGMPLVLDHCNDHPSWNKNVFSIQYWEDNHGNDDIICRDHADTIDIEMTVQDFATRMKKTRTKKQEPLYAKDVTCPRRWRFTVMDNIVPPFMTYMGKNDLSTFSPSLAAENLMIYVGGYGSW
ncbi:hypothetical protein BGZ65_008971 [Modicella reniformis]|uniref:Uncharacterized protein n=1 Tax=Modicella reniformis TaxID=1440133 RepID=A0A9P6MK64_9FUNG|nr:hypothetical protein BGZ65_008971 [Modicella reniformis]